MREGVRALEAVYFEQLEKTRIEKTSCEEKRKEEKSSEGCRREKGRSQRCEKNSSKQVISSVSSGGVKEC